MKSSHGTDFSRMMRSMRGNRQVGCFSVRTVKATDEFLTPRLQLEIGSRKPRSSVFVRRFSTDLQEEQMARLRNQAQMNEIKSQLIKLVDEEIKGSQEELDFCDAYLARTGFKLAVEPEGRIMLSKSLGKLSVKVWFNTEDEDEGDEDAEGQEDEEPQEITSDTRISGAEIDVIIQITLVDKSNKELTKLTLSCLAELDKLFIETMHSADGNSTLEFDELSDQLQWKIYEYLGSLHVDNDLAQFVTQYTSHSHDHKNVAVLKDLKLTLLS